jgi:hypothetical protein
MTRTFPGLPAELLVASQMAAHGWNIYTPHRDIGVDFIATKDLRNRLIIRPVQVKGCYLSKRKDSAWYGKMNMELKQMHEEIVLAIPYFAKRNGRETLIFTAFLPFRQIRKQPNGKYRATPARIKNGQPLKRRDFRKFFDDQGLMLMESNEFSSSEVG